MDAIFHHAAAVATAHRIDLARMAVEETGMGIMEDKVIKNHFAAEYVYNKYKDVPTCGVITDDPVDGYREIAEPLGVVACIVPTTNPTFAVGSYSSRPDSGLTYSPGTKCRSIRCPWST